MNVIFHFLFNYLFVGMVFGDAWSYLAVIFISSVLIDLTHLPYLFRVREGVVKRRFGSESRTRFHELYGLTLFSAILCILYFFADRTIVEISAMCLVLHFAIDFLAGKSMPFYPFSKREVFLRIFPYSYRGKLVFETVSTVLMGVLFWLTTSNLIL
jgi:hypothetical protein